VAYATATELKSELQQANVTFDRDDDLYEALVDEASEAIDRYCLRTFEVPGSASARTFTASSCGTHVLDLDDIASTSGLAVATGTDGTYTALDADDWFAEADTVTGMVTGIRSTGRFPRSSIGRRTVQVTARWGWPAVPGPVHRACLIWARRLYTRKDSPSGVLGFGDLGAVRLPAVDPDVRSLLDPFVARWRLIA
jgi:hypothetical protein